MHRPASTATGTRGRVARRPSQVVPPLHRSFGRDSGQSREEGRAAATNLAGTGPRGGVAGAGVDRSMSCRRRSRLPTRPVSLPVCDVLGYRVPVAVTFRSRLLGLSFVAREGAGTGLLIPRCRSIHTFGMRFALEVVFLDERGAEIRRAHLPPCRLARERRAAAVLELPARSVPGDARTPARGQGNDPRG